MSKGILKLMNLINHGTISYFKIFLKSCNVSIDESYYEKIQETINKLSKNLDEEKSAETIVFTYIGADFEELCNKCNIPFDRKPISWCRNKIKMMGNFNTTFEKMLDVTLYELEKLAMSLEIDPNLNTIAYPLNEDVMNLNNRDTVYKGVTKDVT